MSRTQRSNLLLAIGLIAATGCRPHDVPNTVSPGGTPSGTERVVAPTADEDRAVATLDPVISDDEILPTIAASDADAHVGHEVYVVGTVARTGKSDSGHVFLNFTSQHGKGLVGFIHRNTAAEFSTPPDEAFVDRKVRVRGEIYRYTGKPNVRILSPTHVTILPADTKLADLLSDRRRSKPAIGDVITVASLNVYNLFDARDDPYHADEGARTKPRAELEALAAALRSVNADVVALAEVENRDYLERFNQALLRDLGYRHVVLLEGNDTRGIDVALLSRLPVGPVTSYRHLRFADGNGDPMFFRRDLLRVRIESEQGLPFDVFCVHLKSKFGDDQGAAVRLGEARQIRRILDDTLSEDADARFLVCGDFNDDIHSPALQAIVGDGAGKLGAFYHHLKDDARVTYNKKPYRSMIDFIFASPAMSQRYVADSYHIAPGSPTQSGSDHNIVSARFRLK